MNRTQKMILILIFIGIPCCIAALPFRLLQAIYCIPFYLGKWISEGSNQTIKGIGWCLSNTVGWVWRNTHDTKIWTNQKENKNSLKRKRGMAIINKPTNPCDTCQTRECLTHELFYCVKYQEYTKGKL